MPPNLDIDVLRSLVTGMDLGSFAKAADRLGRSQSAISLQLRKLEEQIGVELLRKQGRGLALTEPGEVMLAYARRLLALNDEAVTAVRGPAVAGELRFGLPQDFAETWFPKTLALFARAHPQTRIGVTVDRNAVLLDRLDRGELDLILVLGQQVERPRMIRVADLPMAWIGSREMPFHRGSEAVPLAMFEAPCIFRQAAGAALDPAGIAWRVVFTSPGLSGLWAAVAAGLGISLRTVASVPPGLRVLDAESGLPPLPEISLMLIEGAGAAPSSALARFKEILLETCREALGQIN